MADEKLSRLEQKKKELEQELVRIQGDIDKSLVEVKEGVSSNMDPKKIIRKHPLPIVGASVIIGFLLGKKRKDSPGISSKRRESSGGSDSPVAQELKRMLAKKGLSILMDYLDQQIATLRQKNESSTD